jgi:uncharacterized protein YecT (DUF1311 family)
MRALVIMMVALVCAGLAQSVRAGDMPLPTPPQIDCKLPANQMELDYCAGVDFKAADGKLNALYQGLMAKYNTNNQALLRDSEEKWIAWRDSECAYENALTVGGTIHPMMETQCDTEKTNARIKDLERQRDCEEGDISCNPPL